MTKDALVSKLYWICNDLTPTAKPRVEMLGFHDKTKAGNSMVIVGVRSASGGSGFQKEAVLDSVKEFAEKPVSI